uniref:Rab-GAP TBC domain-containing protein n=1 Tax=Macrostomum lignano TaxID=282301 RepID=A0A1I8JCW5_9PLAT
AELIKTVTENWHRIDKDVTRCDRHITFFSDDEHLEKLRNIMCCYVWENLQVGYIQGFCDLLAPLLIVLEDEGLTLACFEKLMLRMVANFPTDEVELRETTMSAAAPEAAAVEAEAAGRVEANGPDSSRKRQHRSLMNQQLANLSAALQVMDPQLHEHIVRKGEQEQTGIGPQQQQQQQTICYNDVFLVWETIWAAAHLESSHFSIFVAVALLQEYRSFIMENDMNLADVTMFYIDMAERHNASNLLQRARDLLDQLIQMYFDRVSTGEVLAQRGFISPADKEAGGFNLILAVDSSQPPTERPGSNIRYSVFAFLTLAAGVHWIGCSASLDTESPAATAPPRPGAEALAVQPRLLDTCCSSVSRTAHGVAVTTPAASTDDRQLNEAAAERTCLTVRPAGGNFVHLVKNVQEVQPAPASHVDPPLLRFERAVKVQRRSKKIRTRRLANWTGSLSPDSAWRASVRPGTRCKACGEVPGRPECPVIQCVCDWRSDAASRSWIED